MKTTPKEIMQSPFGVTCNILKSCIKILGIKTAVSINQPTWQNTNIKLNHTME